MGRLPEPLNLNGDEFNKLWHLHPEEFHIIKIHGRPVRTPRWQQAYGHDYAYTGRVNWALPMDTLTKAVPRLTRILEWSTATIDERLNGLLLNWYDAALGHYIGPHRDSRKGLIVGAPIVTISFGETRTFRLLRYKKKHMEERGDFLASNGTVFVTPYETNLSWKHAVPKGGTGRRISVTLRAFR
jgi:alkylated DNA repair dioxygenase AlkB